MPAVNITLGSGSNPKTIPTAQPSLEVRFPQILSICFFSLLVHT